MASASIPVDLFNPGQVLACLGFLEAAETLLGDAEGGFDWSNEAVRFALRTNGLQNPFEAILEFLAHAKVRLLVPVGYSDSSQANRKSIHTADNKLANASETETIWCAAAPAPISRIDSKTLAVRLECEQRHLDTTHWCDGSSRKDFKLFAGQQSPYDIVQQMLGGSEKLKTQGVAHLWKAASKKLTEDPFGVIIPMGGSSFKFDARKAWTGLDAGCSPDEQGHAVASSPVVELLAAIGLEHARPYELPANEVRYAAWGRVVPPILARPVLAGARIGIPLRLFRYAVWYEAKQGCYVRH